MTYEVSVWNKVFLNRIYINVNDKIYALFFFVLFRFNNISLRYDVNVYDFTPKLPVTTNIIVHSEIKILNYKRNSRCTCIQTLLRIIIEQL